MLYKIVIFDVYISSFKLPMSNLTHHKLIICNILFFSEFNCPLESLEMLTEGWREDTKTKTWEICSLIICDLVHQVYIYLVFIL